MIFLHANPCKFRTIEGKKQNHKSEQTRLRFGNQMDSCWVDEQCMTTFMVSVWECVGNVAVCGGAQWWVQEPWYCVQIWTAAHQGLLCMSYLIVISANRNRESHQQAMWGSQGLVKLMWMIKLVLPGGESSHFSKKVQIELILIEEKSSVCWKKIIIPRCGDLYFHLLLQYWFIRNIVAFKITTFVCGYLFEMMSKYCIMFYVHYLLVVGWSPFNVLCMYSCQVTFTQIWKTKMLKRKYGNFLKG